MKSRIHNPAGRWRLSALWLALAVSNAHAAEPRERSFEFVYAATLQTVPAGTRRVDLWIPVPHDNEFQSIADVRIDAPGRHDLHLAEFGNRMLHVQVDRPVPAEFQVTLRCVVTRKEHIQPTTRPAASVGESPPAGISLHRWLQADRLVPIDGKIQEWARDVVAAAGARTDVEQARAVYEHVVATVKYDKSGQGWGSGDIQYACDARRGNCTDFHAIFCGYCRAVGIPARFAIGFELPAERGTGEVAGYHCWAEFHASGIGWVPVDASEAAKHPDLRGYYFGAHDENRVEFSVGRDLTLEPKQSGELLNFFVYPYAEADGKPFTQIKTRFTYRDQSGE